MSYVYHLPSISFIEDKRLDAAMHDRTVLPIDSATETKIYEERGTREIWLALVMPDQVICNHTYLLTRDWKESFVDIMIG